MNSAVYLVKNCPTYSIVMGRSKENPELMQQVSVGEGEMWPDTIYPVFDGNHNMVMNFITAIVNMANGINIKPIEVQRMDGELKAQSSHLSDMQKIVFKLMDQFDRTKD